MNTELKKSIVVGLVRREMAQDETAANTALSLLLTNEPHLEVLVNLVLENYGVKISIDELRAHPAATIRRIAKGYAAIWATVRILEWDDNTLIAFNTLVEDISTVLVTFQQVLKDKWYHSRKEADVPGLPYTVICRLGTSDPIRNLLSHQDLSYLAAATLSEEESNKVIEGTYHIVVSGGIDTEGDYISLNLAKRPDPAEL